VFKRQTGWGPHPPTHHQHNTARVRGHRSVSVFFFPVSVPSTSSRRIVCSIHRRSLRIHSSRRNAVYSRVESCRRTESDPLRLSLRSCAFVRPLRGAYRDDAIPRLFARKKSTLPPDPPSSSIDFSPLSSFHPSIHPFIHIHISPRGQSPPAQHWHHLCVIHHLSIQSQNSGSIRFARRHGTHTAHVCPEGNRGGFGCVVVSCHWCLGRIVTHPLPSPLLYSFVACPSHSHHTSACFSALCNCRVDDDDDDPANCAPLGVSLSILGSTVRSLTAFRHIHIRIPHLRTPHPQSFRRRIHRVSKS
jgi:hypothetical protein